MKKLLVILFLFVFINVLNAQEKIPYLSPGLRIGWLFRNKFTIEPKVSLGIVGLVPGYLNITFSTWDFLSINKKIQYGKNYKVSVQYGRLSDTMGERKVQLFYGAGLGVSVENEEIAPLFQLFNGLGIFATGDFVFKRGKGIDVDIGILGVLPIPLKKLSLMGPAGG